MNGFLLDTNVISELRKAKKADVGVTAWFGAEASSEMWLSVLVVGELRRGVALIGRRDLQAAGAIGTWLDSIVRDFADRILPITERVAERWALITVPDPVPAIHALLAATAIEHDLVLVTRNVADVQRTGVAFINPFAAR